MTVQTGVRTRAPGYAQLISWTTNSAISRTTLVTTQRCSQKCTGRSLWILRLNLEGSAGKYWLYSPLVCCSLCVWWYVCTGLCVRRHLYGCSLAVVILNSTSSSKLSRSCDCAPCKKKKKKKARGIVWERFCLRDCRVSDSLVCPATKLAQQLLILLEAIFTRVVWEVIMLPAKELPEVDGTWEIYLVLLERYALTGHIPMYPIHREKIAICLGPHTTHIKSAMVWSLWKGCCFSAENRWRFYGAKSGEYGGQNNSQCHIHEFTAQRCGCCLTSTTFKNRNDGNMSSSRFFRPSADDTEWDGSTSCLFLESQVLRQMRESRHGVRRQHIVVSLSRLAGPSADEGV